MKKVLQAILILFIYIEHEKGEQKRYYVIYKTQAICKPLPVFIVKLHLCQQMATIDR